MFKKGEQPAKPVHHWNSKHKRVSGGYPAPLRRIDKLRKYSDARGIPLWMVSEEEFKKIFSDVE